MAHIQILWLSAREQSAGAEILRRLRQRLGEEQVDNDTGAPPGAEGWLLVVIGPDGARSLREPLTPEVRRLAEALARGTRLLPLLVAGATLPDARQLPEKLRELTRHGALELTEKHWEGDLERLFARLLGPVCGGGTPPPKARSKFLARFRAPARPASRERPKMSDDDEEAMAAPPSVDEPACEPPSELVDDQGVIWTGGAAPEEKTPEEVRLGAAAPAVVRPGSEFTASFTAYVPHQEEEVRRLLAKSSPRGEAHLGLASCRWLQGTRVVVRLRGRGLTIDPPQQEFVWRGGRNLVPFDVEVPKDAPEETVVLKFDVLIEETVVPGCASTWKSAPRPKPRCVVLRR